MKLKLLQLSHNFVVFLESYGRYLKVYYSDGHMEIVEEKIQNLISKGDKKIGYKNPIFYKGVYLYPSKSIKEKDCQWINLDYLDEKDSLFVQLLLDKNLYEKAIKMYLREKEKKLKEGIIFS